MRRALLALPLALAACSRGDLASSRPEDRAVALAALASSRSEGDWPALLVGQADSSPLVRKAAAGAFTARGGPRAVEALGLLARDPDPEVAMAAARGLAALPQEKRVRPLLVEAWWQAPSEARPDLAAALAAVGGAPREAVELEARRTWERNARALQGSGASRAGAAEELGRSGRAEAVKLLVPAAAGPDPVLAAAAARGLGHSGDPAARQPLLKLLSAADAAVAEAAIGALAELADPAAADGLALLGRAGPERLATSAVVALGQLPQAPEVGVGLCEVALRAGEPAVALRAARLARQRDAECPDRPVLARLARRGPDLVAALGVAAELRLPADRTKEWTDRLLPLALGQTQGTDAAARAAAALALGRLGAATAGPPVLKRAQELRDRLLAQRSGAPAATPSPAAPLPVAAAPATGGAGTRARTRSTGARSGMGTSTTTTTSTPTSTPTATPTTTPTTTPTPAAAPSAHRPLARAAAGFTDSEVGGRAPYTPAELPATATPTTTSAPIPAPRSRPAPRPARAEPVAPAELGALVVAAARLRTEGAGELAGSLLGDPEAVLRASAAEALGALGGPGLRPVAPLLRDPAPEVRLAAARALGNGGGAGAEALAAAAAIAADDDPEWSAVLARALAETGEPAAVTGLARLLDGAAAGDAAAALGRLGAKEGAAPLEAHLARRAAGGRAEALEALSLLSRGAGATLARDLWSHRPEVRAAAARAVGRLRYEAASPWLEALRSDYCGAVRRAAVEALARLPSGQPARH